MPRSHLCASPLLAYSWLFQYKMSPKAVMLDHRLPLQLLQALTEDTCLHVYVSMHSR